MIKIKKYIYKYIVEGGGLKKITQINPFKKKVGKKTLALVDFCTCEDDLVLDLSASTCISIFLHLYFY
jgi:hypothetical protein